MDNQGRVRTEVTNPCVSHKTNPPPSLGTALGSFCIEAGWERNAPHRLVIKGQIFKEYYVSNLIERHPAGFYKHLGVKLMRMRCLTALGNPPEAYLHLQVSKCLQKPGPQHHHHRQSLTLEDNCLL